ncbi:hypothetical protein [Geodermatophilus chilensis]|uniref:hypothetical protein n=1 Tax=Geodermatophilus chilensis TaxID=2035835 RepID=UPI000C2692FC|nr:hypothetical protein [Geodermatophilus chilensis]
MTAADRARVLATLRDGINEQVPAALAEQQRREEKRLWPNAPWPGCLKCGRSEQWHRTSYCKPRNLDGSRR